MYRKMAFLLLLSQSLLFAEVGMASWYGEKFQGRTTSSGEKFDMYAYTAAHRTLPFGTVVTVTNLRNGRSVNVKVNDRGPYKASRIIDLSYQAAKAIGLVTLGVAKVRIDKKVTNQTTTDNTVANQTLTRPYQLQHYKPSTEEINAMKQYALSMGTKSQNVVNPPKITPKKLTKVQVGSFANKKSAERFIRKEKSKGYKMEAISYFSSKLNSFRYKVVILCESKAIADKIVKAKIYNGAYIVR